MKKQIITIAGNLGSGKSTTAKGVAERLDWPKYSSGDFMRKLAQERNMTLNELSLQAESDPAIDFLIDQRQKEFMENHDKFVIDSRLGFYWAPQSFKVLLTVNFEVSAKRVWLDHKNNARFSEKAETIEDVRKDLIERSNSEKRRYFELYGIENHTNPDFFDLAIDTAELSIEETVDLVIKKYKDWSMVK